LGSTSCHCGQTPLILAFFELVRHGVGDPGLRGTALDGAAGHRDGLEQELRADFFGKTQVNGCRDRKLKLADGRLRIGR
jgi:hypothetical protein